MSRSTWAPSTLVSALVTTDRPAVISRAGPRAGASSSRMKRPSRKLESRSGASRKSSAEREGGVSTTMRSWLPSSSACRWSWPSFSIAMYSCVPANELDSAT